MSTEFVESRPGGSFRASSPGATEPARRPGAPPGAVIVTGFEPFHGRTRNRSWDLVSRLEPGPDRTYQRMPVDFVRVRETVLGILETGPRALLMVGETSTSEVLVEQIALNVADTDEPDNAGRMPQNEPLIEGGALALTARWDARALAGRMHQEGIPAIVSFHAGTFVCNAGFYHALDAIADRSPADRDAVGRATAVGFLHVPNSRGSPGLRAANLARAVELALAELLEGGNGG